MTCCWWGWLWYTVRTWDELLIISFLVWWIRLEMRIWGIYYAWTDTIYLSKGASWVKDNILRRHLTTNHLLSRLLDSHKYSLCQQIPILTNLTFRLHISSAPHYSYLAMNVQLKVVINSNVSNESNHQFHYSKFNKFNSCLSWQWKFHGYHRVSACLVFSSYGPSWYHALNLIRTKRMHAINSIFVSKSIFLRITIVFHTAIHRSEIKWGCSQQYSSPA